VAGRLVDQAEWSWLFFFESNRWRITSRIHFERDEKSDLAAASIRFTICLSASKPTIFVPFFIRQDNDYHGRKNLARYFFKIFLALQIQSSNLLANEMERRQSQASFRPEMVNRRPQARRVVPVLRQG
jgi:hypothetical protein